MEIKGVVKAHGFTLQKVADEMGITKGAISQIVNGAPNIATLRKIAAIVGCQIGDFFKDEMSEDDASINGFIEVDGKVHRITSKEQLIDLAENLKR